MEWKTFPMFLHVDLLHYMIATHIAFTTTFHSCSRLSIIISSQIIAVEEVKKNATTQLIAHIFFPVFIDKSVGFLFILSSS